MPEGVVDGASDYVGDLPRGWDASAAEGTPLEPMFDLARRVYHGTACDLPGVTIPYDRFVPAMWGAVRGGYVDPAHGEMIGRVLRWGTCAGINVAMLKGQRVFSNYESATGQYRDRVTKATEVRVESGRTLHLGRWSSGLRLLMAKAFGDFFIFPMGAQAKPLEPDSARPTDDHTRTGLNAATDMSMLTHSLDTMREIARLFLPGWSMHVTDVKDAFLMLPLAPQLWPFFFHRGFPSTGGDGLHLYGHISGDFGTRGFPGVFKIFFVDVVLNMARWAKVLEGPVPCYVDDLSTIRSTPRRATGDMQRFQAWASKVTGTVFKWMKDRRGSPCQLMLGLWWDSFSGTRTLEESKLHSYSQMLWHYSSKKSLSLRERQSVAGRMQRAILTMPPGAACLLANLYALMRGLSLPWQQRRTTWAERRNYRYFYDVLQLNMGRGYFSYHSFEEGPTVYSDASKQRRYAGGGWVESGGRYDWFQYGTAAARRMIDFLEGDTVCVAVERLCGGWRGKWIPFGVDNQAFQKSALKGWSRAERLTDVLRRLFVLQISSGCLLRFFWVASADNYLADALSREGQLALFWAAVRGSGLLSFGATLTPEADGGRIRTLDMSATISESDIQSMGRWRPRVSMPWYSMAVAAVVLIQAMVRGWLVRKTARLTALVSACCTASILTCSACGRSLCVRCRQGVTQFGLLPCRCFHPAPSRRGARGRRGKGPSGRQVVGAGLAMASGVDAVMSFDDGSYYGPPRHCSLAVCVNATAEQVASLLMPHLPYGDDGGSVIAMRVASVVVFLVVLLFLFVVRGPPVAPSPKAGQSGEEHRLRMQLRRERASFRKRLAVQRARYEAAGSRPIVVGTAAGSPPVTGRNARRHAAAATDHANANTSAPPRPPPRRRPAAYRVSPLFSTALLCLIGGAGGVARDGYSAQMASVPYVRSTLYLGLPPRWMERLDEVVDKRLSESSMRSVRTAAKHWEPIAARYGWPMVIATDCLQRGAKLVTFVLHLLDDTDLVADSIANMVWGLRWYMKLHHQADPVLGVLNWHDFFTGVRVLAHVPHEPRRAVPQNLLCEVAEAVNVDEFWEVQAMFWMAVLYFTFSRSECPCPKNFTGRDSWDPKKHWMVRDIVIKLVCGVYVLAVRFKAIKQDARIERPEARGDGTDRGAARQGGSDWAYVGAVPGHILDPFRWYRLLMQFYRDGREPTEPFFMARDRVRPYTYSAGRSDMQALIGRVQLDADFAPHGLRVGGYNDAKAGAGEDLATAHGLWKPGSNSRYDRFDLRRDIFPLSTAMVAPRSPSPLDEDEEEEAVQPRPLAPRVEARRSEVEEPESEEDDEPSPPISSPTPSVGEPTAHLSAARNIARAAQVESGEADSPPSGLAAARRHRVVTRLMARQQA